MKGTEEKTTLSFGLRGDEVLRARREHGENILSRQKRKSFLRQFLGNLNDPVIRILLAALAIHLLLLLGNGDLGETIGIGVAVFLATLISTLSEYGSARAFERLEQDAGGILCRVRRGGTVVQIPIREVVVGDIVLLSAGDAIPADGRLLLGALSADQSAMTGESREVRKYVTATDKMSPDSPVALFRGCTVTEGGGEMLVGAVGDKTFLGEISREIQTETRESPLRRRLTKLAKQISIFGYIAAALVAFAYLFNTFVISSGWHRELIFIKLTNLPYLLENLLHAFTLAVSVLVTCVPEGLPMMVAVVLAANMKRMARDRVLVRKPVGIEAAGSMNILFTDKTGTLTEGKMKLSSLLLPDGNESTVAQLCRSHSRTWELTSLALHLGTDATKGVDADGKSVALGVVLCIAAAIPLMVTGMFSAPESVELASLCLLVLMVACAVYIFVKYGTIQGSFQKLLQEGDYEVSKKKANKKLAPVIGAYWCIATAIFLAWSFLADAWEISWVVWPVAGVLFAAFYGIMSIILKD